MQPEIKICVLLSHTRTEHQSHRAEIRGSRWWAALFLAACTAYLTTCLTPLSSSLITYYYFMHHILPASWLLGHIPIILGIIKQWVKDQSFMDYFSCLSYSRDGNILVRHPMEKCISWFRSSAAGRPCGGSRNNLLQPPPLKVAKTTLDTCWGIPTAAPITLDTALPLPSSPALEEQGGGEGWRQAR